MSTMMRVRLKADGRIVEILADGSERAIADEPRSTSPSTPAADNHPIGHRSPVAAANGSQPAPDAAYARGVRARTRLTQAEFAARIGVPIETVRNWEQGKRCPRGPARALLKVIERAPDVAFAVLSNAKTQAS
jgi:putative transcriptional regulator